MSDEEITRIVAAGDYTDQIPSGYNSENQLVSWNGGALSSASIISQYQQQSLKMPHLLESISKPLEIMGMKGPSKPSAAQVAYRLVKLIGSERKTSRKQQILFNSIGGWLATLHNPESCRLLVEFNRINDLQIKAHDELVRKLEGINLQLTHVYQREQKMELQWTKRQSTENLMREQERKKGEGQDLHLAREKMEELDASIEVLQDQLVKSINTSLKSAFADYVICLQTVSNQLKEGCDDFFQFMNSDTIYKNSFKSDHMSSFTQIQSLPPSTQSDKENRVDELADQFSKTVLDKTDTNVSTDAPNLCLECNRVAKDGVIQHELFCRYATKARPESPQNGPGRMSFWLPSLGRHREPGATNTGNGIWQ